MGKISLSTINSHYSAVTVQVVNTPGTSTSAHRIQVKSVTDHIGDS